MKPLSDLYELFDPEYHTSIPGMLVPRDRCSQEFYAKKFHGDNLRNLIRSSSTTRLQFEDNFQPPK